MSAWPGEGGPCWGQDEGVDPQLVFKQEGIRGKEGSEPRALGNGECAPSEGGWAAPQQDVPFLCRRKGNGGGDGIILLQEETCLCDRERA